MRVLLIKLFNLFFPVKNVFFKENLGFIVFLLSALTGFLAVLKTCALLLLAELACDTTLLSLA